MTNAFFPGQRFKIQRHQAHVGEYLKEPSERHLVVQILDSAWAERRGANGSWAQFLRLRSVMENVAALPMHTFTPCDIALILLC
jgi:hypothetical protein